LIPVTTAPRTAADTTPLDEVMLAMDIVDTLRHERSTVDRELEADLRDDALVARIRQIYSDQGIAVTDELVRKGVEALKQDRFTYQPPKPSFALRLAHVYIARWQWLRRLLLTSLLLGAGWVLWQLPQQWRDHRAYSAYSTRVDALSEQLADIDRRIERLDRWHAARSEPLALIREPVAGQLDAIKSAVSSLRQRRAALQSLDSGTAEAYRDNADAADRRLGDAEALLAESAVLLATAEARLHPVETLDQLAARFESAAAVLAAASLQANERSAIDAVLVQAESALRAGNLALAQPAVARLDQIGTQLGLAYELRIVSADGVRSGVWRHPVDNPQGRNFYLVVEAIAEDGGRLTLPILNEETQQIESVSRFAVRVPEAVYEEVKADKLDNGLIDQALVGRKQRGVLEVQFDRPVAGGYITRWEQ
jgi:hypothetical protein